MEKLIAYDKKEFKKVDDVNKFGISLRLKIAIGLILYANRV